MCTLKRSFAYLILFLLLVPVLSTSLKARGAVLNEFSYTTEDQQVIITDYNGHGGSVHVPSEIYQVPVRIIAASAFENDSNITDLILPETITEIRSLGLSGLDGLQTLEFTGDQPQLSALSLQNLPGNLLVRYRIGADGFTAPEWKGYTAMPKALTTLSGPTRYETAVEISKRDHYRASTVILATALDFPDALAGGPLAFLYDAPILLTHKDALSRSTQEEIERLEAKNIMILGGVSAISAEVENTLVSSGYSVTRVAGENRFATAVEIMELMPAKDTQNQAILASGMDYADALSISSYAAMHEIPILLTNPSSLPSATKAVLMKGGIEELIIVGGTVAVGSEVEAEISALGIDVTRVSGGNRFSTAEAIAETYFSGTEEAFLGSGMNFPDALTAAPYAASLNAPVLLTRNNDLPEAIKEELSSGKYRHLTVLGGDIAISEGVKDVASIIVMISTLPETDELTKEDAGLLNAISAYADELSEDLLSEVSNLNELINAQTRMKQLFSDEERVNEVIAMIHALPEPEDLTYDDRDPVSAAREAYDALTEELKTLVTNYPKLLDAETRMDEILSDKATADTVSAMIAALPAPMDLLLSDEDAVLAARAAYDSLSPVQKGYVTNLDQLMETEARLAVLKADKLAADAVVELIAALPEPDALTLDDEEDLTGARTAYDALTANQKSYVTNYQKLLDLEAKLSILQADKAASDAVILLIDTLPALEEITLEDQSQVAAARAAYDGLTPDQKALVTNHQKLLDLEGKLAILLADKEAADAVMLLIDALPALEEITLEDQSQVAAARGAYDALTPDQKVLVTNHQKLLDLEAKLSILQADKDAADAVVALIAALPEPDALTLDDEEDLTSARTAYNALTANQKSYVTNHQKLLDLEAKLSIMKADKAAADAVVALIAALPEPDALTLDDEEDLTSARTAYDALTANQKSQVTNHQKLLDLEAKLSILKADKAASDAVILLIDGLPALEEMTLEDQSQVAAARAAYDALTPDQKALVTNHQKLLDLEGKLAILQADKEAADAVMLLIDALPALEEITLEDQSQVAAARAAYDGLTPDQKVLVTNHQKLLDLEAKLSILQADKDAADAVVALIAALPEPDALTLDDEEDLTSARTAYDALTANQKSSVSNYQKLLDLEAKLSIMKADKAAADAVALLIDGLPSPEDITLEDKPQVAEARNAYNSLTLAQKAFVDNLSTLEAAEAAIEKIEYDMEQADAVEQLINALPEPADLTLSDKEDAVAARNAYDALTEEQKTLVSNLQKLLDVEERMNILEATAADDADIASAIALLPDAFMAEEDVHENLLTTLWSIDGMSATGTTLSLISSNDNVASDGLITYTDEEVTGSVTVQVSKGLGTMVSKAMEVTVSKALPKAPIGTLLDADAYNGVRAVLYTRDNFIYYKEQNSQGRWLNEVQIGSGSTGKMDFDGSGISHILYVTGNDLGYRFGSNESFSSEERITSYNIGSENGSLTSPDLAVTPDGTVHITYSDSHASADDYSNKDIMYGRKNPGEPFITNLVFRGYRDYSSSGSWGANYFNAGSRIAVTESGQYFIIAHKQDIWRWPNGTDNTYSLNVTNGTETKSISTYGSNVYAIYDMACQGDHVVALYKDTQMKSAQLTFGGPALFSNVHVLQGAPSSISTDGANRYISGINGGRLEVYFNSTLHTYEDVPAAGNFAGTMLTDGTFYSAYTDSTSTIKVIHNQIP